MAQVAGSEGGANAPDISPWEATSITDLHFGPGRIRRIGEDARRLCPKDKSVLIVADAILTELGQSAGMTRALEDCGVRVNVFDAIQGDPKEAQVDAAAEAARAAGAGMVVAFGGGAALDIGKLAACVAARPDAVAADFALCRNPLPEEPLAKVCVPTTAGTGSEVTRTSVISDPQGAKLWHWGEQILPEHAILDPEVTVTLPPVMTAWTGLDAFVHALEGSTNRWASMVSQMYGHEAMRLLGQWLPVAVADPENLEARSKVLWGATAAGLCLHLATTAIAHCISHSLASLGPVHHGFSTALAQEATLAWQVEGEIENEARGAFAGAARACGVSREEFPDWFSDFLDRCGVERRLPAEFADVTSDQLVALMWSEANAPMRENTVREVAKADARVFADKLLAMAG